MADHIVKILLTEYVTPDVKRFVVEKPAGYTFTPGQATDVSINMEGLKEHKRPFTFTSLNDWSYLEFTIKIYREHKGVTKELELMQAGEELIIGEPYGAISYKGPGVFLAGGAGVTPFIAIFRQLFSDNNIAGNMLIFSTQTSKDVIYGNELVAMLGENFYHVLTRENVIGFHDKRIDEGYLKETIRNFSREFYVCGPPDFVTDINNFLTGLGADSERIVFEK